MQSFTVHLPDGAAREEAMFVPDRWSWPAFAFGPFWLVWHRQWLALCGYIMLFAALAALGVLAGLHPTAATALSLLLNAGLALEGHQIRRWRLDRAGSPVRAIITARSLDDAEVRFFDASPMLPVVEASRAPLPPQAGPAAVLGVFPQPGGRF